MSLSTMLKRMLPLAIALAVFALSSLPALACGGLIAPDGDVRLARAATLVAWHHGIERYLTSFSYQGNEKNVGWIVPLPAVPLKLEEGGAWTLQRLARETAPPEPSSVTFAADRAAGTAQVIQRVQIEALNITVIRGSGPAIIDWATSNGFFLNGDTRSHLLIYANASPIFMAAKYNTAAAQARHQLQGDGVPVLITMKLPAIWVPLEVLALDGQTVHADLYFLTDEPLNTSLLNARIGQSSVGEQVPGATGFQVAFQEPMNATLYHDLSTDRNMSWVWSSSWLTYLSLDAPSNTVTYDLGIGADGILHLAPFGTPPMAIAAGQQPAGLLAYLPTLPMGTPQVLEIVLFLLAIGGVLFLIARIARSRTEQALFLRQK
jgi:Uncharacterized protein conserved in bacteria (DUF2330)